MRRAARTCWPTSSTWSSVPRTKARHGPAAPSPASTPRGSRPAERAPLLQEIEIRGAALVAEEKVGFGTTPSLTPAGLVPKPYAVRMFVAATANGFAVHAGRPGHDRRPRADRGAQRARRGVARRVGGQRRRRLPPFTSLWRPTIEAAQVRRSPHDLPSRAADNLFWLGRYTERADWTMRVLRICLEPPAGGQRAAPGAAREPHRAARSCSPRTTARCPASGRRPTRA